jgi:hypothetical protein
MIRQYFAHQFSKTHFLLVLFLLALTFTMLSASLYHEDALQNAPTLRIDVTDDDPAPTGLPLAYHNSEFFATGLDCGLIVFRSGKPEVSGGSMLSPASKHHAPAIAESSARASMRTDMQFTSIPAEDTFHIRC